MVFNWLEKQANKYFYILAILICCLAAINLFFNLGLTPIEDWDESRHAINAYEMIKNGNYFISTFGEVTDYWNLKPPLGMWAIALSYKIFGFSVFALRFPSAVSALLTIALIMFGSKHHIGSLASILAGTVLATTTPFLSAHAGRTGDFDAMMALFMTLFLICLFKARERHSYLYIAALALSAAFLLKSYSTLQMFITGFLYLLLSKDIYKHKPKHYFYAALCAGTPVLIWAIVRMSYDGLKFFKDMIIADVWNRSTTTIEGHVGGYMYYFNHLETSYWWLSLFFILVFMSIPYSRIRTNSFLFLCSLGVLVPFVLFSIVTSKFYWYINTIYPFLALLIGALFVQLMRNSQLLAKAVIIAAFCISFYKSQDLNIEKFKSVQPYSSYALINEYFDNNPSEKGSNFYISQWSQQAQIFVTKVIHGMNTTYSSKEDYVHSGQGFLILPIEDKDFASQNNLPIVSEDDHWIIVYK